MGIKRIITGLLISPIAVLLLTSCVAETQRKETVPKLTIGDVLKSSGSRQRSKSFRQVRLRQANVEEMDHYTRTERKELKGLFPRLPNPDMCMYVFPHLSSEGATIPGYSSCFSLYDKNHYALPGEMSTAMMWEK